MEERRFAKEKDVNVQALIGRGKKKIIISQILYNLHFMAIFSGPQKCRFHRCTEEPGLAQQSWPSLVAPREL